MIGKILIILRITCIVPWMKCRRPSTNNYYVIITFIIHHSIAVQIRLLDHIVHLLLRQFLPKVRHHVSQLLRRDQPVLVLVEHSGKQKRFVSFFFFNPNESTGKFQRDTWTPRATRPPRRRPSSFSTSFARTRWTRWYRSHPDPPRSPYLAIPSLKIEKDRSDVRFLSFFFFTHFIIFQAKVYSSRSRKYSPPLCDLDV